MNRRTFFPRRSLIPVVFLLAGASGALAASAAPDDLKAGLVRFALATDQLASVQGFFDDLRGESADFLRARMLLRNGHTDAGIAALKQVAEGQHHRAEAALLLGRKLVEQGQGNAASQWFERAHRFGFGETRQEASYQLAELARMDGRIDRAGQILASMDGGYWAAVGYLNLASDYARADLNPTRALVALRVALAMAKEDAVPERREALQSRLLVRAGYLAFQNGEHDKAIGFLEKVSLESYNTPQALYLHGLSLAEKGNQRAAMQSWHRAKKYPLAFPGVAEAWIGMGRGFDLSGYLGQAGEAYLAANAAYESERVTLRKLSERIQQQGAFKTLVADARETDLEWFLADSRTLTQPRMAYLLTFLERPEAQKAVSRVAELAALGQRLKRQGSDLNVFIKALDDQLATLDTRGRAPASGLRQQQAKLEQALAQLSTESPSEDQKRRLRTLANTLAATKGSLDRLESRARGRPSGLRQQLDQVAALRNQTVALQGSVARLVQQAEAQLDKLALAYVAEQDRRMAFSLDRTEQQIAHLYEYLALENLPEGPQ